jgi:hypothetical protein
MDGNQRVNCINAISGEPHALHGVWNQDLPPLTDRNQQADHINAITNSAERESELGAQLVNKCATKETKAGYSLSLPRRRMPLTGCIGEPRFSLFMQRSQHKRSS